MDVESSSLRSYLTRRILQAVPLVFGVIVLTFMIIHVAPGDPAYVLAGETASPEYIEMVRESLGLDKPLYEQLVIYIGSVMRGDLGYSYVFRQPVLNIILERVPATLLLMSTALVVCSAVGIALGVISSKSPYSIKDNITTAVSILGYSLPVFWLAQILLLIFAVRLDWFPVQGIRSLREELIGIPYVLDMAHHLVLPAFALGMFHLALVSRLTRASMLEVLRQDFITTAWSKGLDENTVFYRHALRNALLPVVTVIGLNLGVMLTGAVLTESVFAWPGLGRLMYDAISSRDYPVLMGNFIVVSISVIAWNLVTDVVYGFLDPRIRYR
jgi:peptide/nickel transport system permease protein